MLQSEPFSLKIDLISRCSTKSASTLDLHLDLLQDDLSPVWSFRSSNAALRATVTESIHLLLVIFFSFLPFCPTIMDFLREPIVCLD